MKSFSSLFSVGLLAVCFLTFRMPAAAQAPAWQSARVVAAATAAATSNYSDVKATAVDAAGNVYLAGSFTNSVVLGGTTLTSLGGEDVFVAKFNPASNQFVWAQRAGGSGEDGAEALAVNGTNVYVTGYFFSLTASFGPAILNNTASGTEDGFVAKLADAGSSGSFAWAQRVGGTVNDEANGLAVSGASVYVAGFFSGATASFGAITLTSTGTNGFSDIFVTKLIDAGSTGSFVWAQRAGGLNNDFVSDLVVNGTSVYVAGYFNFYSAGFGSITLTNAGGSDGFVAKLTDAGTTSSFAWAQRVGGVGNDYVNALAVSANSVYSAGIFGGPTSSFGPTTLTNIGGSDGFVAKLTDAGSTSSFAWTQQAGGSADDYANALTVSGASVYVTGGFTSPSISFGSTTISTTGGADAYVAKLTDAGSGSSFAWVQRVGGIGNENALALTLMGTNVYVAGYFQSPTASFGLIPLSNTNTTNLGFLAALTDPTLTPTIPSRALTPAQLYPNPAHHAATLRLPAGTAPAPLTLTDALGRAVRRYPAPAGPEAALDLRGLPAGLYLLRGAGLTQRLAVE